MTMRDIIGRPVQNYDYTIPQGHNAYIAIWEKVKIYLQYQIGVNSARESFDWCLVECRSQILIWCTFGEKLKLLAPNPLKLNAFSNISIFFVCGLQAMQMFSILYVKKILFGTSNRSKIFQTVFEIQQIYENNKPKKMHQIWLKSYF